MRRVLVDRPFIAGMVTDQPASKIGSRNSAFAQDLIAPEGIAIQRKGWAYDGTTADAATNLIGVWRNKFLLADVTRTITCGTNGTLYLHNSSAAGTSLMTSSSVKYLPRCVYRDELMLCAQDGHTPMRRWSGASSTYTNAASTYTNGRATISATASNFGTPVVGMYYLAGTNTSPAQKISWRVAEVNSNTNLTIEEMLSGVTGAISDTLPSNTGTCYPAVIVYNAGTVTHPGGSGTLTGVGTKWVNGDWGAVVPTSSSIPNSDAALLLGPVDQSHSYISAVGSDTTLTTKTDSETNVSYAITRRLPFKDAATHKGSLWGTGVAQFPNNVYVFPPGWNPSFPPGFIPPIDPNLPFQGSNANDFLADTIAVPTAYEGDVNVAILSSPSPLLVLKRSAVHGIFGSYPSFTQDKIADGVGCIDLRSAISGPFGQFWAGEDDVYGFINGQVIPLMAGKISREWQGLIADFDFGTNDYCAIGETNGHLFVSIVTGAGAANRCYVYDIRNQAWTSRFTNHKARYFFSSKVDGETNELYWVGDNDQGRVMKSTGAIDGTNPAKDGDGDSPRMQAWTPEGIDGTETIDNDSRLLDLSVAHNVYDAGAAGATQMAVSVVSGGSLEVSASSTKTLDDINSDSTDRVDRTRYRTVNTKGRLHQVRFDVDTLGTNSAATKVEVHELTGTFRDRRGRT